MRASGAEATRAGPAGIVNGLCLLIRWLLTIAYYKGPP